MIPFVFPLLFYSGGETKDLEWGTNTEATYKAENFKLSSIMKVSLYYNFTADYVVKSNQVENNLILDNGEIDLDDLRAVCGEMSEGDVISVTMKLTQEVYSSRIDTCFFTDVPNNYLVSESKDNREYNVRASYTVSYKPVVGETVIFTGETVQKEKELSEDTYNYSSIVGKTYQGTSHHSVDATDTGSGYSVKYDGVNRNAKLEIDNDSRDHNDQDSISGESDDINEAVSNLREMDDADIIEEFFGASYTGGPETLVSYFKSIGGTVKIVRGSSGGGSDGGSGIDLGDDVLMICLVIIAAVVLIALVVAVVFVERRA